MRDRRSSRRLIDRFLENVKDVARCVSIRLGNEKRRANRNRETENFRRKKTKETVNNITFSFLFVLFLKDCDEFQSPLAAERQIAREPQELRNLRTY